MRRLPARREGMSATRAYDYTLKVCKDKQHIINIFKQKSNLGGVYGYPLIG